MNDRLQQILRERHDLERDIATVQESMRISWEVHLRAATPTSRREALRSIIELQPIAAELYRQLDRLEEQEDAS